MAAKADLGTRIVARAFHRQHLALTKLVVKDIDPRLDAVRWRSLLLRHGRAGKDLGLATPARI